MNTSNVLNNKRDTTVFILFSLALLQVFIWSIFFNLGFTTVLLNVIFQFIIMLFLWQIYGKWKIKGLVTWQTVIIWINIGLLLVSIAHWQWLSEDTTEMHTGISDGVNTLLFIKQISEKGVIDILSVMHSSHFAGHLFLLFPVVSLLGIENFYSVALFNFAAVMLTVYGVLIITYKIFECKSSVPAFLFMIHPFSILFSATIYKEPFIVLGTVLIFLGIYFNMVRINKDELACYADKSRAFLVTGLTIVALLRLTFCLAMITFICMMFILKSLRNKTILVKDLKLIIPSFVMIVMLALVFQQLDILDAPLGYITRLYNPEAVTMSAETGDYVMSENSIGARFMGGTLLSRIATLPIQIIMQLLSPFPPQLLLIKKGLYFWAEEWFGTINLSIFPFFIYGTFMEIKSKNTNLRLIPVYILVVMIPVLGFGGVLTRHLFPAIPFILATSWLGFKHINGVNRMAVFSSIPLLWGAAYIAYFALKSW